MVSALGISGNGSSTTASIRRRFRFPLIVPGAIMIEPTETESRHELDAFIEAMLAIAKEAEENPELVKTAPHRTRIRRVDEAGAARKPVLRWKREWGELC